MVILNFIFKINAAKSLVLFLIEKVNLRRFKFYFMKSLLLISIFFLFSFSTSKEPERSADVSLSNVSFKTTDRVLQKIVDRAEFLAKENIIDYGGRKVMKEGAKYVSVWLETQPMGGAMYAKRDMEIARNNIEIFIDYQREDGRFPGVIYNRGEKLEPNYCQFQGFYLARPAFELYFLLNKDKDFLLKVYQSLAKFDAYLWKTRDSDHNGCLETWCIFDNGEDHNVRFNGFPNAWSFDYPPTKEIASRLSKEELKIHCKQDSYDPTIEMTVPIESMDVMSYSYSCRDVLALISAELKNGQEEIWRSKANEVKAKLKSYLWDEEKMACFDRDKNNEVMPILLHNNLRCMYFDSFDQEMADQFIKYHLLNPKEFWTPMPLPSIAANDPKFENVDGNNWSGQPQGLTYQRSIQALENYGHYAELTMIGRKFLDVIGDSIKFTQQFDPFKAVINNSKDGYGPSILSALEFISRFYGIHITQDQIYWSCLQVKDDFDYQQKWNGNMYRLQTSNGIAKCLINDKEVFSFSKGARIVTDLNGTLIEAVGIETKASTIQFKSRQVSMSVTIEPNGVYRQNQIGEFVKYKSIGFSGTGN